MKMLTMLMVLLTSSCAINLTPAPMYIDQSYAGISIKIPDRAKRACRYEDKIFLTKSACNYR